MSDCTTENSCETKPSCGPAKNHQEQGCTMAEDILCLAKSASQDLLKEKMKQLFEVKVGKKLDQIAEVAVDAVLLHMQQTMAQKQSCNQYKENLMEAFKA